MPLTRYQIRNEYSLADPELYRAADKDDPEALLEGVAMAGLVGVLRQLGDLAEFAAEIFHDLHEEVMATAARGHGLMVRVQQLETDFPSIEKAFLSQTSQSMFFHNTGVDWHPNQRMDQNLITQGDLPRFVMDSYEECRGPPRLFLLDKFDVAGAGACLKRYTDPSFFKMDSSSSGLTKPEIQREKKTRKAKKKGSRWRNGETPEVLPTSHAKLHQLFLEERVENYVNDPARRVKLKRRLNGFPFQTKTGKSYMEKFLNNPTPDHNVVRDISINSSPLKLPSNINGESGTEILDISTMNPGKELPWRNRSPCSSPDVEETGRKSSINELNKEVEYGISEVPNLNPISEADNVHDDVDEKEIAFDVKGKIEGNYMDGSQSDDIASEVENYMDALTTMDSEMETDTECRAKKDRHFLSTENQGMDSDANVEQQDLQTHFSDSQSIGNSTATDDENSSSRKGIYSFSYSDSVSNSAENAPSDGDVSAKILQSTGTSEAEIVSMSSDLPSVNQGSPLNQAAEHMVCNGVCTEEADMPCYRSEYGQPSSSSCLPGSTVVLLPADPGKSSMEGASAGLELDEISSDHKELNTFPIIPEESTTYLGDNLPCTSNCSDDPSQTLLDFLPELSCENHSVHEVENEDPQILSHASLHLPNILELPPGKESSDNSLVDVLQAEHGEDEGPTISVGRQIDSSHSVPSRTQEKLLDSSLPELETWLPDIKPDVIGSEADDAPLSGERTISSVQIVESPQATHFAEQQFPEIPENVLSLELDSAKVGSPYQPEKYLGTASSAADGEELGESSPDMDIFEKDAINLKFPPDLQNSPDTPTFPDMHLDVVKAENVHSEIVTVDAAVADIHCDDNAGDAKSLSGSPTELQDSLLPDLRQYVTETKEVCSLKHLQESGTKEEVDQQGVASSFLDPVSCITVSCDDSNSEVLNKVPDSAMATLSRNSLHIADATTVPLSSDQDDQQTELKSAQQMNATVDAEDAVSSPSRHMAELRPPFEQKAELQDDQFDEGSQRDQDDVLIAYPLSRNGSWIAEATTVPLSSDQDGQQTELKSAQQMNATVDAEDAVSSPSRHVAELRPPFEQKAELQDDHFDEGSQREQDDVLTAYPLSRNSSWIAEATTVPLSSDQHDQQDQQPESKSSLQSNTIEDAEDDVSSPSHHIAELRPPLERKVELLDNQFDGASQRDHDSESKSSQRSIVVENAEDAVSSPPHHIGELKTHLVQKVEQDDQFDVESLHADKASSKPFSRMELIQSPNHSDAPSEIHVAHLPSKPSVVEFLPQLDVSEKLKEPSSSFFPSFGQLPEVSQTNLNEMPPLPPLPPMQWRIGRVQHASLASKRDLVGHNLDFFSQILPSTADENTQLGHPAITGEITQPSNPFLPHSANSQHSYENLPGYMVHSNPLPLQMPTISIHNNGEHGIPSSGGPQSMNPFLVLPAIDSERSEHGVTSEGGTAQPGVEVLDAVSTYPFRSFPEERDHPLHQSAPERNSEDEKLQETSVISEGKPTSPPERGFISDGGGIAHPSVSPSSPVTDIEGEVSTYPSRSLPEELDHPLHHSAPGLQGTSVFSEGKVVHPPDTTYPPPTTTEDDQPLQVFPSEGQTAWSSSTSVPLPPFEDGKPNGNRQTKLPRPRNPLIDAVVAHDKSKLRKVTERVHSLSGQKIEERDTLLEQIRTKSFNLKPAVLARPSIQGPKTNLKVAAILQKANAIRQAFAGSDEDDDADSWSDS